MDFEYAQRPGEPGLDLQDTATYLGLWASEGSYLFCGACCFRKLLQDWWKVPVAMPGLCRGWSQPGLGAWKFVLLSLEFSVAEYTTSI